MKDKPILITGAGGALGEAVYELFKNLCQPVATDINLNEPWLVYLDITSRENVAELCQKIRPEAIINLAALTDLEYCENHPSPAYQVNGWGALNLLRQARLLNIPFVQISTAGIFDGKKEIYSEDDTQLANPLNIYGKSKYLGELISRSYPKAIIIRCGWMMGGGPRKDKKFVNKIIGQLKSGSREIFVVTDKMGTPAYTYDIAQTIRYLLDNQIFGLYHGGCAGGGSRLEIAGEILTALKLKDSVKIRPVNSDYFQNSYFAPRPASEKLSCVKLSQLNPALVRPWQDCLEEYLKKFPKIAAVKSDLTAVKSDLTAAKTQNKAKAIFAGRD